MNRTISQFAGITFIMVCIILMSCKCNDGRAFINKSTIYYIDGKTEIVYVEEGSTDKITFYHTKEDAEAGKNKVTVPMSRIAKVIELNNQR